MKSIALSALLVVAACGTNAVKVSDVWFDRNADFAALRTFAVRPIPTTVDVGEALVRDVERTIRDYLTGRGYREAADGADFEVATAIEAVELYNARTVDRGRGAKVEFTILKDGREIWRSIGSAAAAAKTTERPARILETVDTTLRRFPPKPEDY